MSKLKSKQCTHLGALQDMAAPAAITRPSRQHQAAATGKENRAENMQDPASTQGPAEPCPDRQAFSHCPALTALGTAQHNDSQLKVPAKWEVEAPGQSHPHQTC